MTHQDKVTTAEKVVAVFKHMVMSPESEWHKVAPDVPTTEEGMVYAIIEEYGFDLLEAIAIVKRVEVV